MENLKAPIYLGWGGLGNDEQFSPQAKKYFEKAKTLHQNYLHDNFENNLFYHPQYLMGRGKYRGKSIYLKSCFFENTTQPTNIENIVFPKKLDKEIIFNGVVKFLAPTAVATEITDKTFRIPFVNFQELQITVTKSENGYMGIWHTDFNPKENYFSKKEYSNKEAYMKFFADFGYSQSNVWLGKKNFSEFDGSNEEEIIENIIAELNELQQELQKIE